MLLLHVSDIHFRAPDCLSPDTDPERPYRTMLIRDVRSMVAKLGAVDAMLVGGDIAFKGDPQEYVVAMNWLGELAAVAGCPTERIFVVPGNHDVNRAVSASSAATRDTQAAIVRADNASRERVFRERIRDGDTGRALLNPLNAYNDFAKPLNCQVFLPDRVYWKQDLELGSGVVLRIHGLTSVLLSGRDGQNDTREGLYLSPLQTVLDPVDDVVNLVLCHHPPDWLLDQDDANDAICERAQVHMFGHKHRQRIVRDTRYVRFSAGAVNPDRNDPGWSPGYNLVNIVVEGDAVDREIAIEAHLRQWQASPEMFRATLDPNGSEVFAHRIRIPGHVVRGAEPRAATVEQPVATTPEDVNASHDVDSDGEAAMGDASTRNLIFRFWDLRSSQRRSIAMDMGLIAESDLQLPEAECYGRALIKASELGRIEELATRVAEMESSP